MKNHTIVFVAAEMCGQQGYSYEVIVNRRVVLGGWSPGKKHHAEKQAREHVIARRAA